MSLTLGQTCSPLQKSRMVPPRDMYVRSTKKQEQNVIYGILPFIFSKKSRQSKSDNNPSGEIDYGDGCVCIAPLHIVAMQGLEI